MNGPGKTPRSGCAGSRILVVDDEPAIRLLVCRVLAGSGYVVELAGNGQEALLKVNETRPDLVVLDIMMPVMDGWEVLRRLRTRRHPPPVLILSCHLDRARAAREGATAWIEKPFTLEGLLTACARMLQGVKA